MNDYKPSEQDIESVLNSLKLTDPAHATRDWAIAILKHVYATLDRLSFDNPEELERIIQDLKHKKKPT